MDESIHSGAIYMQGDEGGCSEVMEEEDKYFVVLLPFHELHPSK
jgi:hypothetical protein